MSNEELADIDWDTMDALVKGHKPAVNGEPRGGRGRGKGGGPGPGRGAQYNHGKGGGKGGKGGKGGGRGGGEGGRW